MLLYSYFTTIIWKRTLFCSSASYRNFLISTVFHVECLQESCEFWQTVCIVKCTFFIILHLLGRPRNFPLSRYCRFIIMLTKWRYFNLSHLRTLFISEISGVNILLLNYTTVSRPLSFSDQTCVCSSLFHPACKVTSLSLCWVQVLKLHLGSANGGALLPVCKGSGNVPFGAIKAYWGVEK